MQTPPEYLLYQGSIFRGNLIKTGRKYLPIDKRRYIYKINASFGRDFFIFQKDGQ
jgi:hypothetical protein